MTRPADELPRGEQIRGTAKWTCSLEHGPLWYVELDERANPPYRVQREVRAIIDIDGDGRLAGIELIDYMPAPPKPRLVETP